MVSPQPQFARRDSDMTEAMTDEQLAIFCKQLRGGLPYVKTAADQIEHLIAARDAAVARAEALS